MLIQWLVLSELSKEPSKLHNAAPITFLLITFVWSGLQTDDAAAPCLKHPGKKATIWASTLVSHKNQSQGWELVIRWMVVTFQG